MFQKCVLELLMNVSWLFLAFPAMHPHIINFARAHLKLDVLALSKGLQRIWSKSSLLVILKQLIPYSDFIISSLQAFITRRFEADQQNGRIFTCVDILLWFQIFFFASATSFIEIFSLITFSVVSSFHHPKLCPSNLIFQKHTPYLVSLHSTENQQAHNSPDDLGPLFVLKCFYPKHDQFCVFFVFVF